MIWICSPRKEENVRNSKGESINSTARFVETFPRGHDWDSASISEPPSLRRDISVQLTCHVAHARGDVTNHEPKRCNNLRPVLVQSSLPDILYWNPFFFFALVKDIYLKRILLFEVICSDVTLLGKLVMSTGQNWTQEPKMVT